MGTKTCTKCGETKPATREFWYFRDDKPISHCKACRQVDANARYRANPARAREQAYAARRARADDLRQYNRDYYQLNHERKLEINREYRNRNRDKVRATDRARARPTRERNRDALYEWYGHGCRVCGLVYLPGGMQAHHRDAEEKDQSASQLLNARKGTLELELAKCDPFCASHHLMLERMKENGSSHLGYEDLIAQLRATWLEMFPVTA